MTDISLEERLARSLAGRLLGYTEGDVDDIANVKDSLEDALKDAGVELCKPVKAGVYVAPNPAEVSDFLEEVFKNVKPQFVVTDDADDDDEEEDDGPDDDGELAELEHMRDVADMAYAALSDLALHCHNRREDVAWGIASSAAKDAHTLATFVGDWIEDMEDED
ncbi:hypothetical protein [Bifidobacterium imperatoris]|uniref:Uncharacterized protein n=1 Tax=Bifidobacterium imperatoris TaxID=2020965 RepID=A0A2N5ISL7_9BIFI|nr:hypothetical protein [Bifidobacterium imperatoris]PLS24954.1 hypothetical protein Tam1G_0810 [Bifidobacterium imperatoris]